jgi:predicted dehydrogenase
VQDFVDCLLAGRPTRVTAQDGLHALAISTAAERSYRESRPVALDAK